MASELLEFKEKHFTLLLSLRYESGFFSAAKKDVWTGYDKAWLRDNFYVALALHELGEEELLLGIYRAFINVLLQHESKIDHAINQKPQFAYQYIHPRYSAQTLDELWEPWGNKQNDAIGAFLFLTGLLKKSDHPILQSDNEKRIIKKLVEYLQSIEYWHDQDSGIWEEWEEIHASSLGACIAGLNAMKEIGIYVPDEIIQKGEDMLHYEILPRESHDKFCDLALLTLIYPFNVVNKNEAKKILRNVEYHFVKQQGVIRYKGDHYYNKNVDRFSEEAEWSFGFSFLSLAYHQLGNKEKASFYFEKAKETINEKGEIPELYYSNSNEYNDNSPLTWAEAMFLIALTHLSNTML